MIIIIAYYYYYYYYYYYDHYYMIIVFIIVFVFMNFDSISLYCLRANFVSSCDRRTHRWHETYANNCEHHSTTLQYDD